MSEGRNKPTMGDGPIPQELVDRFFDRDLDDASRQRFFSALRADLPRCAEVAKTQRMISMLREPVTTPDLTEAILHRIRARRAFLPEQLRRFVKAGRLAAAACVLLGVVGFALGRRYAPDFFRLVPEQQPVSKVVESGRSEAVAGVQQITGVVVKPIEPPQRVVLVPPPGQIKISLSPGKTSVALLPTAEATGPLVVYGGAGSQARFVIQGGVCVDRITSVSLPVYAADGRKILEWIDVLRAEVPGQPLNGQAAKPALADECNSGRTPG